MIKVAARGIPQDCEPYPERLGFALNRSQILWHGAQHSQKASELTNDNGIAALLHLDAEVLPKARQLRNRCSSDPVGEIVTVASEEISRECRLGLLAAASAA